ncbi:hypothetical protein SDC9_89603 [bioreactor metagenome]|uniref:Uncharacterized protein n=1 Tax=bioreactor metagenome TaxID=1076179 RepID=A0A644ZSR3_9ZZZZ
MTWYIMIYSYQKQCFYQFSICQLYLSNVYACEYIDCIMLISAESSHIIPNNLDWMVLIFFRKQNIYELIFFRSCFFPKPITYRFFGIEDMREINILILYSFIKCIQVIFEGSISRLVIDGKNLSFILSFEFIVEKFFIQKCQDYPDSSQPLLTIYDMPNPILFMNHDWLKTIKLFLLQISNFITKLPDIIEQSCDL